MGIRTLHINLNIVECRGASIDSNFTNFSILI